MTQEDMRKLERTLTPPNTEKALRLLFIVKALYPKEELRKVFLEHRGEDHVNLYISLLEKKILEEKGLTLFPSYDRIEL